MARLRLKRPKTPQNTQKPQKPAVPTPSTDDLYDLDMDYAYIDAPEGFGSEVVVRGGERYPVYSLDIHSVSPSPANMPRDAELEALRSSVAKMQRSAQEDADQRRDGKKTFAKLLICMQIACISGGAILALGVASSSIAIVGLGVVTGMFGVGLGVLLRDLVYD